MEFRIIDSAAVVPDESKGSQEPESLKQVNAQDPFTATFNDFTTYVRRLDPRAWSDITDSTLIRKRTEQERQAAIAMGTRRIFWPFNIDREKSKGQF